MIFSFFTTSDIVGQRCERAFGVTYQVLERLVSGPLFRSFRLGICSVMNEEIRRYVHDRQYGFAQIRYKSWLGTDSSPSFFIPRVNSNGDCGRSRWIIMAMKDIYNLHLSYFQ